MAIEKQLHNVGANAGQLGSAVKNAAKQTFSKDSWKMAEGVADKPGIISRIVLFPVKATIKVAEFVIKKPVDWGLRGVNAMLGHTTEFVKSNPKFAFIGGTAAVVAGGAHMVAKHNSKKLQAQSDVVQQLQAMQAQQAAPVSYMNSASYADVQAKMDADRANGTGPTSQTAAVQAARAAVPAPEAAAGPAV